MIKKFVIIKTKELTFIKIKSIKYQFFSCDEYSKKWNIK